jgi:hypothetical protein
MTSRDEQSTLPDNLPRIRRAAETPTVRHDDAEFSALAQHFYQSVSAARLGGDFTPPSQCEEGAPRALLSL